MKGVDMNICELLSRLNSNQGAIMAVLTAIYVAATILIVWTNYKVIREMRLGREQLTKPVLVASFESRRGGLMCLVLRNLGGSTASKLRIEFLSDDFFISLPEDRREQFKRLKSESLTIVPKQEIILSIGGPQFWKGIAEKRIEGRIVYNDTSNKTNEEPFSIDPESFKGKLLYGTEMDELTTTIKRGFDKIEKALHAPGPEASECPTDLHEDCKGGSPSDLRPAAPETPNPL